MCNFKKGCVYINRNNTYGIIYCALNTVNNKRYIGQTIRDLNKRKKEHISLANNGSKFAFHLAINKYGEDVFEWSTIDVADSQEELDSKESYWIEFYDCYHSGGYNMSVGGQFNKKTDNNADYLSMMNGGKEFLVFDIDGNFEKSMYSQSALAIEIGSCVQSVNNVLHEKVGKHSVKGKIIIFKDKFANEKLQDKLIKIKSIHKEFAVFDIDNNLIGKWSNYTHCNRDTNISARNIEKQLKENTNRENCRKYKVYYIEDIPDNLKYLLEEEL